MNRLEEEFRCAFAHEGAGVGDGKFATAGGLPPDGAEVFVIESVRDHVNFRFKPQRRVPFENRITDRIRHGDDGVGGRIEPFLIEGFDPGLKTDIGAGKTVRIIGHGISQVHDPRDAESLFQKPTEQMNAVRRRSGIDAVERFPRERCRATIVPTFEIPGAEEVEKPDVLQREQVI